MSRNLKRKWQWKTRRKNWVQKQKNDGVRYHCGRKGQMSKDCRERKFNHKKNMRSREGQWGDEADLVLCSLTTEIKKEKVKKKVWFAEEVKQPSKVGMMCTIHADTFFHLWIGDSGALCHIMKDNTSLSDVIDINELIQGSSGIMPNMKKGSCMSMFNKFMELYRSILYGLWSYAPSQVQTCFPWHANSCREIKFQVTIEITS